MNFAYPLLLLLLLLAPLLAWWRHRGPRQPAFPFSDASAMQRLPVPWTVYVHRARPFLYGLGLACLVVALARPRKGLEESRVHTEGIDIVLLADVSTSMRAMDFATANEPYNRLEAARKVVRSFVEDRPNDRIGLIAFAAMPYTASPLTLDHGWLLQRLDNLKCGMLEDGTAIGSAVASAVNRLRESKAKSKVVILLTDGVNNAGSISPENAAEAARALGVKVYAIGAGTTGLAPYPVRDPFTGRTVYRKVRVDLDEAMLQRMAKITGALYFRATDLSSLRKIYAQIDRMEKTKQEITQYTRFEERFAPWLWAGLALLALERWLALTRFGGLPS